MTQRGANFHGVRAAAERLAAFPYVEPTVTTDETIPAARGAADLLHLHHSSVSRRLEQIAKALGIELTGPAGLTRARLALTAWRLLDG